MKTCTTLRLTPTDETVPVTLDPATAQPVTPGEVTAGTEVAAAVVDAQIVDVSLVPDDHVFGLDDQGLLHVEGKIVASEIRTES